MGRSSTWHVGSLAIGRWSGLVWRTTTDERLLLSPWHSFRLAIPHRTHSARPRPRGWLAHSFEEFLQHYRVVVLFIFRCEQQRQPLPLVRQPIEFMQRFRTFWSRQLFKIAPAKCRPATGTRMEPLSQSVRRCQFAQPAIHRGALFGQPARPQAVYQHARPVCACVFFVHSLHRYWFRSHLLPRAGLGFALLL